MPRLLARTAGLARGAERRGELDGALGAALAGVALAVALGTSSGFAATGGVGAAKPLEGAATTLGSELGAVGWAGAPRPDLKTKMSANATIAAAEMTSGIGRRRGSLGGSAEMTALGAVTEWLTPNMLCRS